MKKQKTYFLEKNFTNEDVIRVSNGKFATTVTTDYAGKALEEIRARIYGGAPTIASNVFELIPRQPDGDKFKVKFPVLSVPNTVVQTSSPVYGQCTYTATNTQSLVYIDIALNEFAILDEVCANEFIKDYNGRLLPAGADNSDVPSNVNEKLLEIYMGIASTQVEELLWSTVGAAIEAASTASGTNGDGSCAGYSQTGVLADAEDADKVRKVLATFISKFLKNKKKLVKKDDVVIFVPIAVYEAFQFAMPIAATDALSNVSATIADQLGIYGIHTSHAIADNKIYIMSKSAVGLVTDGRADWENVSVLALGDTDKKNKNKVQYSMFWKFGAGLVKPCESGYVTLS